MIKRFLSACLVLFLIFPIKISAGENHPIKPFYVNSYWWQGYYPLDSGEVVFYMDEDGYSGYISRLDNFASVIGGITMSVYGGILYHPNVKNVPSLSIEEERSFSSFEATNTGSKYVEITKTYPYNMLEHKFTLHDIPLVIFYDDGVYRGYIEHTSSLPVDYRKDRVYVTYGGDVYSSKVYPILGIDDAIEDR